MALRVLLADESVTIKKAFELALQDYGVDIVSVNAGVDVVPVAMKFKPDIVFADVLLQKKNGYELSKELKSLDDTKNIPVVLIWSGFMELDKEKYRESKANDELEKPFDTEKLRGLIQKLIPRLGEQKVSRFLEFPHLPDFQEKPPEDVPDVTKTGVHSLRPELDPQPNAKDNKEWSMNQFEEISSLADESEDFSEVPLHSEKQTHETTETSTALNLETEDDNEGDNEDGQWVSETLSQFKVDKNQLNSTDEVDYEVPDDKIDPDTLIRNQDTLTSQWAYKTQDGPPPLSKRSEASEDKINDNDELGLELDLGTEDTAASIQTNSVSERQVEAIIKAQAREIIEKVVWEIVPEIATQILEREIKKLINEQNEKDLD